jgi:hypothetical protein
VVSDRLCQHMVAEVSFTYLYMIQMSRVLRVPVVGTRLRRPEEDRCPRNANCVMCEFDQRV